jgi:transposase-like protein
MCTCPECKEPAVKPMSVVGNRVHYRCPQCLYSWHTAYAEQQTDEGAT